jgi:hypothetical protein
VLIDVSRCQVTRPRATVRVNSGHNAMEDSNANATTGRTYFANRTADRRRRAGGTFAGPALAQFVETGREAGKGSAFILYMSLNCMGAPPVPVNQTNVTE